MIIKIKKILAEDIRYCYKSLLFKLYFGYQFLTRVIISLYALNNSQVNLFDAVSSLCIGFFFDFVFYSYVLFALHAFKLILFPIKKILEKCKILMLFGFIGVILTIILLNYLLFAELLFWDEFGTRFNFIAVDYIVYTHELIGTLKEEKFLYHIIFVLVFISFLFFILLRKRIKKDFEQSVNFFSTLRLFFIWSFFSWISFFFKSTDKINISSNRYFNELCKNGSYEFFGAFYNNYIDYDSFYPKIDDNTSLKILKDLVVQNNQKFLDNENIDRFTISEKESEKRYNVVILIIESMSANYMGAFGNDKNITPYLDSMAKNSLFFKNFYATGTRTVRGIEAVVLSVPPTPGSSIIRRQNIENMFNVGSIFKSKGYDLSFIFGGRAYFDNLRNFFSSNGYEVLDQTDLRKDEISFTNSWGVCDEDIFNKAVSEYDKKHKDGKNFFSVVVTTSNHRPYTFPDDKIDMKQGSRNAAVKYTDYAVMKFIESSRSKEWFKNTIFVITADHCSSSAGKMSLPIEKYHIPMLIYAPSIVESGEVDILSSQVDIAPTILDYLGFNYDTKFFGKRILSKQGYSKYDSLNRAFIGTYQLLGYMKKDENGNDYLVILSPMKEPEIYNIKNGDRVKVDATLHKKITDEAISYYQSAYRFYSNGGMKDKITKDETTDKKSNNN